MRLMGVPSCLHRWCAGWRELVRRQEIAGYRESLPAARFRLDLRCLVNAPATPGFWRAALLAIALGLAAQLLCWRHDLTGWRRDALQCLPVLLVAPWIAAGRRRRIEALLGGCAPRDATGVTDGPAPALHSAAIGATERRRWRGLGSRWRRQDGPASGGSTSSWWWRASARWRPWPSRASRK